MIDLDWLKRHWSRLASVAVWLTGIVGTFLVIPPSLQYYGDDPTLWLNLCQFLLAVLVGLFFLKTGGARQKPPPWRAIAIVSVLAGVALLIAYHVLKPQWSCVYNGVRVVAGGSLLPGPAGYLVSHPSAPCHILIHAAHGFTERVWPMEDIVLRYLILCALYTFAMLAFSTAVLATIEHLRGGKGPAAGAGAPPDQPQG